jgi:hypothetical protein
LILNNLDLDCEQAGYLGLNVDDEGNMHYFFEAQSKEKKKLENFSSQQKDVISKLSIDDLFYVFISANLSHTLGDLESELFTVAQKNEWSSKYDFDWNKFEELLDNFGTIFVQANNQTTDTADLFDFRQYKYGIILEVDKNVEEVKEKIKQVIKNILAFKYPSQIEKTLPDDTKIKQVVANPDRFSFDQEDGVEFILTDDFNFAIIKKDNYLILGNDKDLIKKVAEQHDVFPTCE